MCDVCGNDKKWKSAPGTPERQDEVHLDMVDKIMEHGCVVQCVYGSDTRPTFFYTVGRAVFDLPELLLVGNLDPQVGMTIINDIVAKEASGVSTRELADNGGTMSEVLGQGYEVKFLRCDPESAEMFEAIKFGGPEVECIQVLWPDAQGNFPDQPAFQRADVIQPIYAR